MNKITIIGAGHVGTTLALVLSYKGYEIFEIHNRTIESAQKSCELIGSGRVVSDVDDLSPTDILIIATNDNALSLLPASISQSKVLQPHTIVFHCSGALSSSVLDPLGGTAKIASVHPIKTFTDPIKDASTFSGTWCGIEGEPEAVAFLEKLFQSLGANTFTVDQKKKVFYHVAIVFMCNYLFPLIETGLECYEEAGVSREVALNAVNSILHATIDNALMLGPDKALTGPIARGDDLVVTHHLNALADFNPKFEMLYKLLGSMAIDLSIKKGAASQEKINKLKMLLC